MFLSCGIVKGIQNKNKDSNMKTFETVNFKYEPSQHVPFRDKKVLERMRKISKEHFINHPNSNLNIKVMDEFEIGFSFMMDIFFRIKEAMENGEKLVMILPQPWPLYKNIAYMINRSGINCRNLYTFNMDEYADQDGNIAPESWPYGFTHSL
jgi:hypothetical protein